MNFKQVKRLIEGIAMGLVGLVMLQTFSTTVRGNEAPDTGESVTEAEETTVDVEVVAEKPARSVRNPFWPVGYVPKTKAVVVETPAQEAARLTAEEQWLLSEITEDEWVAALEALGKPNSYFMGRHPETREPVARMLLNKRRLMEGQIFVETNASVSYTWRVKQISVQDRTFELEPVSAERLPRGRH